MSNSRHIAPPLQQLLDLACLLAAFPLAIWLRDLTGLGSTLPAGFSITWAAMAAAVAAWLGMALLAGIYKEVQPPLSVRSLAAVAGGAVLTSIVAAVASQFSAGVAPRSLFLLYGVVLLALLVLTRTLAAWLLALPGYPRLAKRAGNLWRQLGTLGERLYEWRVDLWLALALGAALAAVFLHAGLNYSPDSVQYVKATALLRYAGRLTLPADWPPLFPTLAALANSFTPFPAQAAEWIVGLSIVVAAGALALIVRLLSKNGWFNLLFIGLLLTAGPFYEIGQSVWSEMPFLALVLLSLYFAVSARNSSNDRHAYLAFTFAALAALARYIGIMLPITLTLGFLMRKDTRKQAGNWLLLGAVSLAPLALYLLRNWLAFGTLTGSRVPSQVGILGNVAQGWATFSGDFFPVLLLTAGVAILAMAIFAWKRLPSQNAQMVILGSVFSVLYLGFLLYTASLYDIDNLDTRLLFPLEMLFMIAALIGAQASLKLAATANNAYLRLWGPVLLVGGLLASLGLQTGAVAERLEDMALERDQPFFHYDDRYRISDTAKELGQAFAEAQSLGFESATMQTAYDVMGPLFLLQSTPFEGIELRQVGYHFNESGDGYQVAITLQDGLKQQFEYFPTTDTADTQQLIAAVEQHAAHAPFLLIYTQDSAGFTHLDEVVQHFQDEYSVSQFEAIPYLLLVFTPN